jgi:CRP/FNR family transcriptional regulator, cyclic AMP receptor protein
MIESIFHTPFFSDIPDIDEDFVLSRFVERHYEKNTVVFQQGDIANEMFIVKSGPLKIYIEEEERVIVVGHQFPGETVGELEVVHYDNHRLATVAAMGKSTLWAIRKPDLESLLNMYPSLLRKLFFVVSERLTQADRKIAYLSFLDARLRVANLLLELHDNFGIPTEEGSFIDWKPTQQHLANMIGVNRESTSRALQQLQSDGIIRIQNKHITILDLDALRLFTRNLEEAESRKWHSLYKYNV